MQERQGEGEEFNGLLTGLEKKKEERIEGVILQDVNSRKSAITLRKIQFFGCNVSLVEGGESAKVTKWKGGNEPVLYCYEKMKKIVDAENTCQSW